MIVYQGLPRDLGDGFSVARVLPQAGQRTVGPFVFFDYFGPAEFAPGHGIDVRPHPHVGLATVTYLFEGSQVHRDSLGNVQEIVPGDVNWMTAGRGIVHSERTGPEVRARGHRMHGIQSWVGLPLANEEDAPGFQHVPKAGLPSLERDGARLCVVTGKAYGLASPVRVPMPIFYVDAGLGDGSTLTLPRDYEERGAMVVRGAVEAGGERHETGTMIVFDKDEKSDIRAAGDARVMLLGGAPLDGPRHVWWNFVSSSRERLEKAKEDWRAMRFATIPGDDKEFIPLPPDKPSPVPQFQ
jgi:redox-sensitive bicupin YhaK (pirin superfamily)